MAEILTGPVSVMINGEDTRFLDFADRGLHYGDGVFTTLSLQGGVPVFFDRHLSRLQADANRLGIPLPAPELLRDEVRWVGFAKLEGVVKIMLTRGCGGRGYRCPERGDGTRIVSVHPKPDYPMSIRDAGVHARFCKLRLGVNPRLAGIKHLNRLEQILARAEWSDEDIQEGLLLDHEGFLVEGVTSNVFLVHHGVLRTPRLDRCGVAGVMRGLVLDAARDLGMPVEEARIIPEKGLNADEMFITNSIIGLWPVSRLDGKEFPVGAMTRLLTRRIDQMIVADLATQQAGFAS